MKGTGIGAGLLEIFGVIASITLIGMIINRSSDVNSLVGQAGNTVDTLLRTATFR